MNTVNFFSSVFHVTRTAKDTLNNGDLLIVQKQVPIVSYTKSIFMSFQRKNPDPNTHSNSEYLFRMKQSFLGSSHGESLLSLNQHKSLEVQH